MEIAIETLGLCKNFGPHKILRDINIAIEKNKTIGIVGPNGAGKTTLLSCIAGFLNPTRGRVKFFDKDSELFYKSPQAFLTILPQDANFGEEKSIYSQLVFLSMISDAGKEDDKLTDTDLHMSAKKRAKRKAEKALKEVDLWESGLKKFKHLSHGMKKRLRVAQCLMEDSEIIILDEPTSGLDPLNAKNIRDIIRENNGKKTMLVSSHNLEEIEDLCDEVLFLKKGAVIDQQSMEQIKQIDLKIIYVVKDPLTGNQEEKLKSMEGIQGMKIDSHKKRIMLNLDEKKGDKLRQEIMQYFLSENVIIEDLKQGSNLEAEFLRLTKGN